MEVTDFLEQFRIVNPLFSFIFGAAAISTAAMTLTTSAAFRWLRNFFTKREGERLGAFFSKLFSCPYCMSHWMALLLVYLSPTMRVIEVEGSLVETLVASALALTAGASMWSILIEKAYYS